MEGCLECQNDKICDKCEYEKVYDATTGAESCASEYYIKQQPNQIVINFLDSYNIAIYHIHTYMLA